MSALNTLNTLKLTAAKKPAQVSATVQRRTKLAKRLLEQIELAQAEQDGTTYTVPKLRNYTDQATGHRKQVEIHKRIRSWVFVGDNGKLAIAVRYGAKILELAKGKYAIEVVSSKEVVPTLYIIKTAVEAGELDAAIEQASVKLREGFTK